MNNLICNEVERCQPARKKYLSHILLHVFCLYFLRMHRHSFFRRGFESVGAQFLSVNIRGKYFYFWFTCSISIHLSQLCSCWIWPLTFSWVQFLSNTLQFFVSCNIKITKTFFFLPCVLIYTFLWKPNCSPSWWHKSLFWHLYQIHTFNNNLNDEEMITSHLMCVIKQLFYDKNIMFEREKNNNRKTLAKHVTWQNHSPTAKFRILKVLKG